MKTVSVETQKKLVFIPIINLCCPFIYPYNHFVNKAGSIMVWLFVVIVCFSPFFVLSNFLDQSSHQIVAMINILKLYIPQLLSGIILIKYQEKLDFD